MDITDGKEPTAKLLGNNFRNIYPIRTRMKTLELKKEMQQLLTTLCHHALRSGGMEVYACVQEIDKWIASAKGTFDEEKQEQKSAPIAESVKEADVAALKKKKV